MPTLQQTLQSTAALAVTEVYNEGRSAANDPVAYPLAEIVERLDGHTCSLCAAVDGMILTVGSPEYQEWKSPSHISCRRLMVYVGADEVGTVADFKRPDAELIRKHGHYHLQPEKHAALRIPAEPAGRNVVVRRLVDPETGKRKTVLDWAPWVDQQTVKTKAAILQVWAATTKAELSAALAELGLTDLTDPAQQRRAILLGVKDRIDGYLKAD